MYTIGIDLGGTHIAVGLVDENFNIVKKISAPTLAQRGPYEITKDMTEQERRDYYNSRGMEVHRKIQQLKKGME